MPGSWVVVDKEGRAVLTPVNTPQVGGALCSAVLCAFCLFTTKLYKIYRVGTPCCLAG